MKLFLLAVFFVLAPFEIVFSQTISTLSLYQLKKLDSVATQDVPSVAPGIATAIIQNGTVIYQKCAGFADFADSSIITPDTRFNIASNGKQFTALAILTLIDKGKLSLTDDIRRFFPALYPAIKTRISIGHLLNHTSGIRDVYDLWSLQGYTWWKQSFNNRDAFALISQQAELNFTPGSQFLYSNSNYILLALLVEKASGKSFGEYCKQMFKNLGMHSTSFEDEFTKIRGPIARAYFNFNTWTTYNWIWNVCGDGNLFSTLNDQIQWEKIIHGEIKTAVSSHLIKQSQQLIPQSSAKKYGYGLEFGIYKGLHYSFHEGATGAWKATVIRFPSKNISLITLTNTGKSIPSMQTRQMADVLFELKKDPQVLVTRPAKAGTYVNEKELTGIYLTATDFAFQFELIENKLYLKRNGRNDIELEREADNIFHQKNDPAFKQEFIRNAKGEMQVTAYYITHSPYTLVRSNDNWQAFIPASLNGPYKNLETNTNIEIKYAENTSYDIIISGKDSSKGILVSPSKLLVNNYSLNFEKNRKENHVLRLNGDRIRRVKFIKLTK